MENSELFEIESPEKAINQNSDVLRHLLKYGYITPFWADREYGIMRLGARIYDLRRMGWQIKTEMMKHKSLRTGHEGRHGKYVLTSKINIHEQESEVHSRGPKEPSAFG